MDVLGPMIDTFIEQRNTLVEHCVKNVEHARWRMLMTRKKTSAMMRAYAAVFNRCRVLHRTHTIVLAVGAAKFSSTGLKGREKGRFGAVPTVWKHKMAVRVARSMGIDLRFRNDVDEFRTTQCCYKCACRMGDVFKDGNVVRGLKSCPTCGQKDNSVKLRNRDLNAAKNIWECADALEANRDRPLHLQRSKRQVAAAAPQQPRADASVRAPKRRRRQ